VDDRGVREAAGTGRLPDSGIAEPARTELSSTKRFDVFLSYDRASRPAVGRIAQRLCDQQIDVWWDGWSLTPGVSWQDEIIDGLYASGSCAVIVGQSGLQGWVREEFSIALDRGTKDPSFRLFVVLLPGAPQPSGPSFAFLLNRTWVDLRAGIDDPAGFQDLLHAITGTPPRHEAAIPTSGSCPYRGLERFEEEHADCFFGRENEVAVAVEKLASSRFLAVLGPSGSGKSSLLRAGLVTAVRRGRVPGSGAWTIEIMTPGSRPLVALAAKLTHLFPDVPVPATLDKLADECRSLDLAISLALQDRPQSDRLLLVVDQFEELFTVCSSESQRAGFLANLLYAASIPEGRLSVVLGMRADFYHRCAAYPELRALVADEQVLVGPLDDNSMRRAIEEPASKVGLEIEPGLVDTIMADVGNRPGALPLLEHVLLEVWRQRRGTMLTLSAYVAAGGVQGALAKRANAVFGAFNQRQQQVARHVLLRLIQPGDTAEDTRRRAAMAELVTKSHDRADVDAVVKAMTDQRLLTIGRDQATGDQVVDIAHEALIRGWPELRNWIDDEREQLRAQRHLTDAALEWDRAGRRDEDLYSGARFASWEERSLDEVSGVESDFLKQSRARRARQQAAGRRRLRLALGGALVAVTSIAVIAFVGLWQVTKERDVAAGQRDLARSRDLVNQSDAQADRDPQLAALLRLAAFRLDESAETRGGLLRSVVQTQGAQRFLEGHTGNVGGVAFSPDGRTLVSGSNELIFWDVPGRNRVATLGNLPSSVTAVAFSPDGRTLAAPTSTGR